MKTNHLQDTLLAICTVLGTVLTTLAIFLKDARLPAIVLLLIVIILLLFLLYKRLFRKVYVIYGYQNILDYLEELVRGAKRSIWTVRLHIGDSSAETSFFEVLATRVMDKRSPVEDVRRNIRISSSESTHQHLRWLVDKFADHPAVKVKYFHGHGPAFDFIVVDGRQAVLGLPMAEGNRVGASIVVKDIEAVRGMEHAFMDLWQQSTLLFNGTSSASNKDKENIQNLIEREITPNLLR